MEKEDNEEKNTAAEGPTQAEEISGTSDEEKPVEDKDTAYPPPKLPSRLVKRIIGGCVLVTLVVVALFLRHLINRPLTKQSGTFIRSTGTVHLYNHGDLVYKEVPRSCKLREGHLVETKSGSTAVFDACLESPDALVPVTFYLREKTSVRLMKPPAVDLVDGTILVRVPKESSGLWINLKTQEHGIPAQCLVEDADILVRRKGNRVFLSVYRGTARLWMNSTNHVVVPAGYRSSVAPGVPPEKPTKLEDATLPDELSQKET